MIFRRNPTPRPGLVAALLGYLARKESFRPEGAPISFPAMRVIKILEEPRVRWSRIAWERVYCPRKKCYELPAFGLRAPHRSQPRPSVSASSISAGATILLIMADERFAKSGFGWLFGGAFLPSSSGPLFTLGVSQLFGGNDEESFGGFGNKNCPSSNFGRRDSCRPRKVGLAAEELPADDDSSPKANPSCTSIRRGGTWRFRRNLSRGQPHPAERGKEETHVSSIETVGSELALITSPLRKRQDICPTRKHLSESIGVIATVGEFKR